MRDGDVVLVGLLGGHDYVGRYVRTEMDEGGAHVVLDDVVRVHDAGVWDDFAAGRLRSEDGQTRAHVSAEPPGESRFPAAAIRTRLWPGDLAALRAWAAQ